MNTPDSNREEPQTGFEQRARKLFDDSVDELDAATLSKLNQARQQALAELGDTASAHGRWQRWMPAAGVAAALVVTIMVARGPASVDPMAVPADAATDFEILTGEDSLEMLEELEFYAWIESAELDDVDNAI